jgi:hypothetical protein
MKFDQIGGWYTAIDLINFIEKEVNNYLLEDAREESLNAT